MLSLPLLLLSAASVATAGDPFLIAVDNQTHIIGNDLWNVTIGPKYGTKLFYKGVDLVGKAVGHYVSYSGSTAATIRYIVNKKPRWLC